MDDDFPADCEDSEVETTFKRASDFVTQNASVMQQEDLLYFYGRYKQAQCGTCTEPAPGFIRFKSRTKWSAWNSLGDMSKEEAMTQYIDHLNSISKDWDTNAPKQKSHFGPVTSRLQAEPENQEESKSIFDYVKEGSIPKIQELLSQDSSKRDCVDENGLTLLHWACDRGYCELVSYLLYVGSDVNRQDKDGQTALHYASSCGHEDVITLLLKHGALTNIYDSDGLSPADVAYDASVKELLLAGHV